MVGEPRNWIQPLHLYSIRRRFANTYHYWLPASPGAASGQAVFHADEAEQWFNEGKKVILCRIETSPEDLRGMASAEVS